MANTVTVKRHSGIGDLLLKIVEVTGDGSTTSITAVSVGLTYIVACWSQDVDDNNALQMSTYSGTSVTIEAISDTKKQLFFFVGW